MSESTTPGVVDQDVDESITRTITFAHDVNGSTINAAAWSVPAGVNNLSTSFTATSASIRLKAATTGTFIVECTVTLTSGEILQTHFLLTVTD